MFSLSLPLPIFSHPVRISFLKQDERSWIRYWNHEAITTLPNSQTAQRVYAVWNQTWSTFPYDLERKFESEQAYERALRGGRAECGASEWASRGANSQVIFTSILKWRNSFNLTHMHSDCIIWTRNPIGDIYIYHSHRHINHSNALWIEWTSGRANDRMNQYYYLPRLSSFFLWFLQQLHFSTLNISYLGQFFSAVLPHVVVRT